MFALNYAIMFNSCSNLWKGTQHFRHLERPYLLVVCGIVYNVIRWTLCGLKRDLLYFATTLFRNI